VVGSNGTISFWANGRRLTTLPNPSGVSAANFSFAVAGANGAGVRPASLSIADFAEFNPPSPANTPGDEPLLGWVDELCVSSGWRYNDQYTSYVIPQRAFTVDTITDTLIHFDTSLTTAAT
jgi:hypothetical protein